MRPRGGSMRGATRKRAFGTAMTIAVVGAMTACGSSGGQPGAQAAPAQPTTTEALTKSPSTTSASTTTASSTKEFVSDRYDFAVTLPQAWAEVDSTVDWDGQHLSGPGSPQFANFLDLATHRTLMAAATTVPAGTTLADWEAAMVRGTPDACPPPSQPAETTTIGGEPALLWRVKCSDGYDPIHLVTLHGDRGYVVYLATPTANDDAEDLRIFEGIRQSFRFTG